MVALVDTLRAYPDRVDVLSAACEALVYLLDDEPHNVRVALECGAEELVQYAKTRFADTSRKPAKQLHERATELLGQLQGSPPGTHTRLTPSYVDSSGRRYVGIQFVDTDGDNIAFRLDRTDPDRMGSLAYVVGDAVKIPGVSTLALQEDGTILVDDAWVAKPQDRERESVHRALQEILRSERLSPPLARSDRFVYTAAPCDTSYM